MSRPSLSSHREATLFDVFITIKLSSCIGLKKFLENHIFWSKTGSGFGELSYTPPPPPPGAKLFPSFPTCFRSCSTKCRLLRSNKSVTCSGAVSTATNPSPGNSCFLFSGRQVAARLSASEISDNFTDWFTPARDRVSVKWHEGGT